jgi:hypothetical protein
MSIESLVLSAWEEEGFVGRTRVPLAMSDVDVLAIHAGQGKVRVGEAKVRDGSQTVYVVDDSSLALIESQPDQDFAAWMEEAWSGWLGNLPRLWDEEGHPAVPWLLPAAQVVEVQALFCCNLYVLCARDSANDALRRAVARVLRGNPALARRLDGGMAVSAKVTPTVEVVTGLASAVFARIHGGYGRRFADHFKDVLRELHRYLSPALFRGPRDAMGQQLGARKAPFAGAIRSATVMALLEALGVRKDELREWLAEPDQGEVGG